MQIKVLIGHQAHCIFKGTPHFVRMSATATATAIAIAIAIATATVIAIATMAMVMGAAAPVIVRPNALEGKYRRSSNKL
jgi:hypothetical protein